MIALGGTGSDNYCSAPSKSHRYLTARRWWMFLIAYQNSTQISQKILAHEYSRLAHPVNQNFGAMGDLKQQVVSGL